ncbi:M81 family metallopeptidase [Pseudooceanicola sp. CBS1P-1]|uniref:Microcystinase C n=1 Tax=Pseudooceanicola albus TaxID=2692189 RepID=A0A6L7G416_9RHOB|nr:MULTISPECIES: M81 family metallopeptidase [Pseudooceanicola]MBT9383517.1 M81 family metallopeptidase [Pseudooceanicola endophyticus]MXN17373.1 microcystin degradation protein MlrC [Pseudooceanicola albus]
MRILLAGFQHETNTFATNPADMAAFEHGGGFPGLCRGAAVVQAMVPGVNIPAAGFLTAARAAGAEVDPILWGAACPSGPVTRATYQAITDEIVAGIAARLPADAVYLDLHGAMVAEHLPDGEGALIERVRDLVGPDMPLVVSLDLHANVTERMVMASDALVAFRTYPHVDMALTGERAFALVAARIARGRPFARAMAQVPYMVPICWQSTMNEPAAGLYGALEQVEAATGVTSLSWAMGFPAADFDECGQLIWAYADDAVTAEAAVAALMDQVVAAEPAFTGALLAPDQAVAEALRLNAEGLKPVVIADAQDNPGAGGSSDTTGLLAALVAADVPDAALGVLWDPAAVAAAHAAGEGAQIALSLGGHSGVVGDQPFEGTFTVEKVSDGRLYTRGPYYGTREMQLGDAACLRIGGVRIVVATEKAQMADREMFRFAGITPEDTAILVVKSAIHFRADFAPIAARILTAVAPGAMMMRATDWSWQHLRDDLRLMPGGPTAAEHRAAQSENA